MVSSTGACKQPNSVVTPEFSAELRFVGDCAVDESAAQKEVGSKFSPRDSVAEQDLLTIHVSVKLLSLCAK
jgi:hypothetical protein